MKHKIFVTGDIHGDCDIHKLNSSNFPEGKNLTKKDYVIIAGDFGLLWSSPPDKTSLWWLNWLEKCPWTTLFVDGNHENHNILNALETVKLFGSPAGKVNDSVFHLRRGELYKINRTKILTIGGAESIDKYRRTPGVSWWPEELLSSKEINYILDKLPKIKTVDYVITHTCPTSAFEAMFPYNKKFNDPTMKFLEIVLEKLYFKHWYFGHFHEDMDFNNFTCLFNEVKQII